MTNQEARDKIVALEERVVLLEDLVLEIKAVLVNMGAHNNAVFEHIAKRFIKLEGGKPEQKQGNIITLG